MTRHPLDGNAIAADAHYDRPEVGTEDGDTCNRWQEPDEDCPKAWRCKGAMFIAGDETDDCWIACDTCGAVA